MLYSSLYIEVGFDCLNIAKKNLVFLVSCDLLDGVVTFLLLCLLTNLIKDC